MEKEVGCFKYQRVNTNNLIVPKKEYEELRFRAFNHYEKKKCEPVT